MNGTTRSSVFSTIHMLKMIEKEVLGPTIGEERSALIPAVGSASYRRWVDVVMTQPFGNPSMQDKVRRRVYVITRQLTRL